MAVIELTRGYQTVVDDADFDWLNQWKWQAHIDDNGYVYAQRTIRVDGRRLRLLMHRFILGDAKAATVDHVDGNTLDNRRANLRAATRSQNAANAKGWARRTSRWKGVTVCDRWKNTGRGRKWRARIRVNDKLINLGTFEREENAATAYNFAAEKYFGEFARFNEP